MEANEITGAPRPLSLAEIHTRGVLRRTADCAAASSDAAPDCADFIWLFWCEIKNYFGKDCTIDVPVFSGVNSLYNARVLAPSKHSAKGWRGEQI